MKAFKIEVELLTPVVLGKDTFWTLDGVCYGILKEMKDVQDLDLDVENAIPLKNEDGLYFASRAVFSDYIAEDVTKIGGIRPVRDMHDAPDFMQSTKKGDAFVMAKVITHRDDYKNYMSRYIKISSPSVSWIAVGDPEAVATLIKNAGAIGARRAEGYGRVGEITIETDEDYNPIWMDGKLMRPVPETHQLAREFDRSLPKYQDTWKPPYFDASAKAVCYIPRD